MSGKKIRGLHVGYGGIAGGMLKVLETKPWYETAAVVDVRAEALAKARSTLNLPDKALFKSLPEALKNSGADVAFLNTPSELHYEQARAALEAGVHPLVAKPITNDFGQALELVSLAKNRGVLLTVGQQIRFNRHYLAVKRFVAGGQLGNVESIQMFNSKPRHEALNLAKMEQPALYEMSCHHFDSLLGVLPDLVPESIVCDGFRPSWSVYSGPCMVNALIQFDRGRRLLYHGGFSSQAECYELRLEGSRGALRCRGIHMSNDTMRYEFAERGGKFSDVELDKDIPAHNPFSMFFDIWYDYVSGGGEPSFSGRNNLKVFALLCAGVESVRSGLPVRVKDNPRYRVAFE